MTIKDANWLALDTEFVREKTYYPKLCLLQVATKSSAACIDPIALTGAISPILDMIYDPQRVKVFHSASQDLEIFYLLKHTLPKPLFDTQIAAPLLGYDEQLSYAALVKQLTGKQLDKTHTRANWAKRPLSPDMIQYALEDVLYLAQIYPILKDQLDTLGRLNWLEEDFTELASAERYRNPPTKWHKFPHIDRYSLQEISAIQALFAWREQTAQTVNKPKSWVLDNKTIASIIQDKPNTVEAMQKTLGEKPLLTDLQASLLAAYQEAKTREPEALNLIKRTEKLNPTQTKLRQKLQSLARKRAADLNMNPERLTRRKDIDKFILGDPSSNWFKGWRWQALRDVLAPYTAEGQTNRSV